MKYAAHIALIACTVFACASIASAQVPQQKMPEATKAIYVAMLYEKILRGGQAPDFEDWVQKSPDYQQAELYQRPDIVMKNSKELKTTFDLLMPTEPIILNIKTRISGYSATMHGFLVQTFNDRAHFDYTYLGTRYAIVPNGLANYQWLKAVPEEVKEIMRETDNGRSANMVISLIPLQVDPKPIEMNGKKYKLMMADISKIELWSKDNSHLVWDDKLNEPASVRSKVLDLFQR